MKKKSEFQAEQNILRKELLESGKYHMKVQRDKTKYFKKVKHKGTHVTLCF